MAKKVKMTSPLYVSGKHVGQVHGPKGGITPNDPLKSNKGKAK